MTRPRLSKRSVVLAAGALLLLCGLFAVGRPWAVAENDRYRTMLRQLRVASAELELDILRARQGLPEVHGSAPSDFAALRARAEELRTFPGFLPDVDRRALGATLDAYERALTESESLLARSREADARGEKREADVALQALLERSSSAEAERLINTYLQLYERTQGRNERSRIAFFGVSLLLGAYVLVVLVRLSRASSELSTLNSDLEGRVEERTAALSTANEGLRASETRKASILEAAPDGILLLDAKGHLLELNPAAERTFRLTSAQAVGRDFLALALPASLPAGERERV
ncbi:DAHL domain-containing protein, partial [Pyxidicoccus sp. 3LG]